VTRARSPRATLWLLLAAALFVRAFVPQGYMAERSADGSIAVTLCASGGIHVVPLKKRDPGSGAAERAEPSCAFAGLGSPALSPRAMPAIAPVAQAQAVWSVLPGEGARIVAQRVRPPARAPPLPA